jgi:hypothetical protein
MPGTRAFEDNRIVELDKKIEEHRRSLRQLKHQRKQLVKDIENEV